jgi:hypothetical protein
VGLGAEAPARAEADKNTEQQKDLLRKRGMQVPATAGTETRFSQRSLHALDALVASIRMVFGVRAGRAVPRRRPRIAVGSALVVAGSVARLRAASAEPLR